MLDFVLFIMKKPLPLRLRTIKGFISVLGVVNGSMKFGSVFFCVVVVVVAGAAAHTASEGHIQPSSGSEYHKPLAHSITVCTPGKQ